MSTEDVPGYREENRDTLHMGCWAEHADGSLILVENTEGGRVVYSIFDTAETPPIEYRDAMADGAFKKKFSWTAEKKRGKDDAWTWHDKTQFPWDRLIKDGVRAGERYTDIEHTLTEAARLRRSRQRFDPRPAWEYDDNAAQRARRSRDLHEGREVEYEDLKDRVDSLGAKAEGILRRLQRAIQELPKGRAKR